MRLSFQPANLLLESSDDGFFRVTLDGTEILRTRSQKSALAKFNAVRQEMEARFPPHEPSPEQKAEAYRTMLKDALVQHNSMGGRKKKTSAGGTRTFGG